MDLTHVIAERENKKIYRDGAKALRSECPPCC